MLIIDPFNIPHLKHKLKHFDVRFIKRIINGILIPKNDKTFIYWIYGHNQLLKVHNIINNF